MPERKSKEDVNETAVRILREATGESPREAPTDEPTEDERRTAARILGRQGGLRGGPARAKKLSPAKRKAIARKAAQIRWAQVEKTKGKDQK